MQIPLELKNRRELFVDSYLIEHLSGAALKLHSPRQANTAIRIDKPWEGPFNGGACVIELDGQFLMYYRGLKPDGCVYLCCAMSSDGIGWEKPELGLHEVCGALSNNVIVPDSPNYDIFLDTRPGTRQEERVKMTRYSVAGQRLTPYFAGHGHKQVHLLASGDGLSFLPQGEAPVITCDWPNAFDSHNIFFWSETENQYICFFRFMDGYRTIARMTSPDLFHWSEPEAMTYGETPREELYTNATMPYFRAPHVYVALPARFMPGRRVVSDEQLESLDVASTGEHVYYEDCSDAVFMSSRAGSTVYDRTFMESFVRPGPGPDNWVSRTNYPLHGIIQTGPEELSFYVSRRYAQPEWHIRRYTVRLDGFTSINTPFAGGEFTTRLLSFTGSVLTLNYATGAAGSIQVELQDTDGRPIPGLALNDCDNIIGDEISRLVTWNRVSDLTALRDQHCRLRFVMKDADIYSMKFD